ncbi:hypothetical protein [Sphaerisporangium sp. TRM90804]|uniref:hypothetical protein n=1 Tax=Sphaerisporangium sp. TRM90804 TaxID=3031113 RepID=UPI002446B192|nr:hypothetical protein [Sphaerisporangium sp. TRM90804]MDH2426454.1 hypothetical protein [Sphaerisporangium sp. TRM90804]
MTMRYFEIRSPRTDFTGLIGTVTFVKGVAQVSFADIRDESGMCPAGERCASQPLSRRRALENGGRQALVSKGAGGAVFRLDEVQLAHPEFGAHKVGLTGLATARLAGFQRLGWQVYKRLPMPRGAAAYAVEQAVLVRLREDGIPCSFLSRADMGRLGGYRETMGAEAISLVELEF